jgi:hypothetical protein
MGSAARDTLSWPEQHLSDPVPALERVVRGCDVGKSERLIDMYAQCAVRQPVEDVIRPAQKLAARLYEVV